LLRILLSLLPCFVYSGIDEEFLGYLLLWDYHPVYHLVVEFVEIDLESHFGQVLLVGLDVER
jgi:hypothetical protein